MARPTRLSIASGIAAWDADADFNFALLTDAPFPLFQVAVVGSLPAASSYDKCLALVGSVLYISNGTAWSKYQVAATQAASTATDIPGLVSDFNALLSKLKAAGIMEVS